MGSEQDGLVCRGDSCNRRPLWPAAWDPSVLHAALGETDLVFSVDFAFQKSEAGTADK